MDVELQRLTADAAPTLCQLKGVGPEVADALWQIVMTRLATDERTPACLARRTQKGHSKREIIRCLKRYVARKVYPELLAPAALAVVA